MLHGKLEAEMEDLLEEKVQETNDPDWSATLELIWECN